MNFTFKGKTIQFDATVDTAESLIERIAYQLDTHPAYLNNVPINVNNPTSLIATDFIAEVKALAAENADHNKFFELWNRHQWKISIKEGLSIWLYYKEYHVVTPHSTLQNLATDHFFGKDGDSKEHHTLYSDSDYNSAVQLAKNPEHIKLIPSWRIRFQEKEQMLEKFKRMDQVASTKFVQEQTNILCDFKVDSDISGLFNGIHLTNFIPFASYDNFFKVHQTVDKIVPEWKETLKQVIIIRILSKLEPGSEFSPKKYVDGFIMVDSKGTARLDLSIPISHDIDIEVIKKRVMQLWNNTYSISSSVTTSVSGLFYIPKIYVKSAYWADMVLTNSIFNLVTEFDESLVVSKKKTGYNFYLRHGTHRIHVNICGFDAGTVPKDHLELVRRDVQYTRVKIHRAQNIDIIENSLKIILARLVTEYVANEEEIDEFYNTYIPSFSGDLITLKKKAVTKEDVISETTVDFGNLEAFFLNKSSKLTRLDKLRLVLPGVFPNSVSRELPERDQPIIIGRYGDSYNEKKYPEILIYPKLGTVGYDGELVQNFIVASDNPENPYPGLAVATRPGDNQYFAVTHRPKLFKKPQTANIQAYNNDDFNRKQSNRTYTSNKFVFDNPKGGELPAKLKDFFELINIGNGSTFKRYGVPKSTQSVLDVLNVVRKTSYTRQDLNPYLCQQSCPGMSIEDIQNYLVSDSYLNPRLVAAALEDLFDTKLILISQLNRKILPTLEKPITSSVYPYLEWQSENSSKDVYTILYIHMGSERNFPTNPEVEYVMMHHKKNMYNVFYRHEPIVDRLLQIRDELVCKDFVNISELKPFELPFSLKSIKGQFVDAHGKVRMLLLSDKTTVHTEPLPCLPIKNVKNVVYSSKAEAREVFSKIFQDKATHVLEELSQISFRYKGIRMFLKFSDLSQQHDNITSMDNYIKLRRTARYMKEYVLWMSSRALANSNIDLSEESSITKFVQSFFARCTAVDTKFPYSIVRRNFEESPKGLCVNGKIIISSDAARLKLMYWLWLQIKQNYSKFVTFKDRYLIERYYVDISDFDRHEGEVVLIGENSLLTYIDRKMPDYNLYRLSEAPVSKQPLFVEASETVHLVQPCSRASVAISVSKFLSKHGYNPIYTSPHNLNNSKVEIYADNVLQKTLTYKGVSRGTMSQEVEPNLRAIARADKPPQIYAVLK